MLISLIIAVNIFLDKQKQGYCKQINNNTDITNAENMKNIMEPHLTSKYIIYTFQTINPAGIFAMKRSYTLHEADRDEYFSTHRTA